MDDTLEMVRGGIDVRPVAAVPQQNHPQPGGGGFADNAKKRDWHAFEDDQGTVIHVSYRPRFRLWYYRWLTPQKVVYKEWEGEITVTGDDLSGTFKKMKSTRTTFKPGLQEDGSTIYSVTSKPG